MQTINVHNLEDCLEILTGLQKHNLNFTIDNSDRNIINSIARQVFRGTAFTDRQFNLIKEKLIKYEDQFKSQEVMGFDQALTELRHPLRKIDRSKFITIVDTLDESASNISYDSYKKDWNWIKIRFPFSKKLIVKIDRLSQKFSKKYYHKKGTHVHYFKLREDILKEIIDEFKNLEFKIDDNIMLLYNEINNILSKPKEYFCSVVDNNLYNFNDKLYQIEQVESLDRTVLYDRRFRYGIDIFDYELDNSTLTKQIANRSSLDVHLKPSEVSTTQIFDSINELERWPLIVVLPKEPRVAHNCILEVYKTVCNIILNTDQSVLFRLDDAEIGFNQFVKEKALNNWVDNKTKIVYISSNKLPKLLLKADWKPTTAIVFDSAMNKTVNTYIKSHCDCIILREEQISPFRRYSQYYG